MLLWLCVLTTPGCVGETLAWRKTEDDRRIPENWSLWFPPPGQAKATRKLDCNSLYVEHAKHRVPPGESWEWYRFWPGGQVLRNVAIHPPTAEDADDFTEGRVGRYSVVGDRVVMEFGWVTGLFVVRMQYVRYELRIEPDGTLVSIVDGYVKNAYRPQTVAGMKREPDWTVK